MISTKVPGEFLNRLDVPISVEKSLRNLGLEHVDVLLAHWPPCWHNFPLKEYARAMEQLVNMREVRYLGLSDQPLELVESFRSYLPKVDVRSSDPVFHPENYRRIWEVVELLREVGEKYGKKPVQVASTGSS